MTIQKFNSHSSQKRGSKSDTNNSYWPDNFKKIGGNWEFIGSGKFNTAQRGDEESRRNRVYKNFIREKGQHKESSKQFRWKQKYISLFLDKEKVIKEDNDDYSSS